ncbi:MAG: hypothetical protein WAR41_12840, partial [Azonexus sp.]
DGNLARGGPAVIFKCGFAQILFHGFSSEFGYMGKPFRLLQSLPERSHNYELYDQYWRWNIGERHLDSVEWLQRKLIPATVSHAGFDRSLIAIAKSNPLESANRRAS